MPRGLGDALEGGKIPPKVKRAFAALAEAIDYADDTGSNRWEFAVGLAEMQQLGLSDNVLRWLVRKGYVEHAREVTVPGDNERKFRTTVDSTFCKRTCFVLTKCGLSVARSEAVIQESLSGGVNRLGEKDTRSENGMVPHWDLETRELRLDGELVKRFRWHAANQEIILNAFQEEGWPKHIDDPLPPQPDHDSKRRLNDTIKCLNRRQINQRIHFRSDGTGQGVVWEPNMGLVSGATWR